MLAPLFGRPSSQQTVYPAAVWAYLNSPPIGGVRHGSRIQLLLAQWTAQGLTGPAGSPAAQRKIAFLTSSFSERRRISLSDLSDRAEMLSDLRGQAGLMKRDLAELMNYLRQTGF